MDSYEENQFEDGFGFDQIEDKQGPIQEAEKLKGYEGTVENPATIRICDFCGKTFKSGKALGGHRRHHFQALRKEAETAAAAESQLKVKIRLPNLKNYENSSSFNDVDEYYYNFTKMEALMSNGGKTTCDLCNKEFPSMKSYYGHMRTHPERDRKGSTVLPPDDDSGEIKEDDCVTTSTVIAPVESPIDLTRSLPNWSKTDLRGRECIGAFEAAQNLIYLSRAVFFSAPKSSILGISPKVLPQAASTDDIAVESKSSTSRVAMQFKEKKVDDSSSEEQKVVRKKNFHRRGSLNGRKDEEEEGANNWSEEECESDMKDDYIHLDESKMNNKKKILKWKSPQSSESEENPLALKTRPDNGYKCIIYGKSFATSQALGAHTSSHNKGKNIIIRTMNEPSDNNGAGFIPQVINETKGTEPKGLVVEIADTAQGLGDHHRKSSSRRSLAETPLSEEASSVGTSLSHSTHQEVRRASPLAPIALDFDLNEPYVPDEDCN